MTSPLKITTFQIGSARKRGEGLRIGTVRYVPHGIKKKDYARDDYFDLMFQVVAPSRDLLSWLKGQERPITNSVWSTFCRRYEGEIVKDSEGRESLILLAEMAKKTPISIGCYCEDESRCHRSILLKLINRAATAKFQHARK